MMQQTPEAKSSSNLCGVTEVQAQPALAWHFEQPVMEQSSEGNSFPRRDEGRQQGGAREGTEFNNA